MDELKVKSWWPGHRAWQCDRTQPVP